MCGITLYQFWDTFLGEVRLFIWRLLIIPFTDPSCVVNANEAISKPFGGEHHSCIQTAYVIQTIIFTQRISPRVHMSHNAEKKSAVIFQLGLPALRLTSDLLFAQI